jgi:asparagine synthetase B (glutamine-hydrolysing)
MVNALPSLYGADFMALPPLANVFAARLEDPGQQCDVERRVAESGELTLWPTAPEWVVAVSALPHGPAEPPQVRDAGLVFAEGRDRLIDDRPERAAQGVKRVSELVANAPQRLSQLPGDFGFLHLTSDTATVVRSCGGLVPFYIRQGADGSVAVATRLDLLVSLLDGEHEIDPLVLASCASGWALNPDGRTFLRGVSVLPRGCYAQITADRAPQIGRYWDPRPERGIKLIRSAEHARRLRELLLATLDRDLDPSGGNLLGLSGGVDSTSIGALAVGMTGRPCATLSFLTPDPGPQAEDLRYIDALQTKYPFDPIWRIVLEPTRWLELIRQPQGSTLQVLHPILCALPELSASADIRVLFGGEAADEMCGSALNLTDWLDHTSLRQLIAGGPRGLPFGRRTALRWLKRRSQRLARRIDLPYPEQLRPFVRPEVQEEYSEWRARRRAAAQADRRPLLGLALWAEHDGWVAMNWEATSALGIRRSLPFYTREVHELSFSCHPRELIGPSTKKLLRAALNDDVPHVNLYRPDKGSGGWGTASKRAFDAELPEALRSVIEDRRFEMPDEPIDAIDMLGLAHLVEFNRRLSLARASAPSGTLTL